MTGTSLLSESTTAFLITQVEALAPFQFLVVGPPGSPTSVAEIAADEQGSLSVKAPGRPPELALAPAVRAKLVEAGFRSAAPADPTKPWARAVADPAEAAALAVTLMHDILGAELGMALDVAHGDRRAQHEAELRLEAARRLIEPLIEHQLGHLPERDDDGDYLYPTGSTQVVVAPRAIPDGPAVVRVFAVTNIGVNVTADLAMFLAQLNVALLFGRFGLDAAHQAVWVDETLLAADLSEESFGFTLTTIARLADRFDDQIKSAFGGVTFADARQRQQQQTMSALKPGAGGYL